MSDLTAPRPRSHALPLSEAVDAEFYYATDAEKRELMPQLCVEWHRTCSYVEDRLDFLARHAAKRCPV